MTASDGGEVVTPERLAEHVKDIIDNAKQLEQLPEWLTQQDLISLEELNQLLA